MNDFNQRKEQKMKKVVLGLAVIIAMMASAGDTQAEQKKAGKSGRATVQKRVAAKKTQAGDAQHADSKLKELEEANKKLEKEKAEMQETMGEMEKSIYANRKRRLKGCVKSCGA